MNVETFFVILTAVPSEISSDTMFQEDIGAWQILAVTTSAACDS